MASMAGSCSNETQHSLSFRLFDVEQNSSFGTHLIWVSVGEMFMIWMGEDFFVEDIGVEWELTLLLLFKLVLFKSYFLSMTLQFFNSLTSWLELSDDVAMHSLDFSSRLVFELVFGEACNDSAANWFALTLTKLTRHSSKRLLLSMPNLMLLFEAILFALKNKQILFKKLI